MSDDALGGIPGTVAFSMPLSRIGSPAQIQHPDDDTPVVYITATGCLAVDWVERHGVGYSVRTVLIPPGPALLRMTAAALEVRTEWEAEQERAFQEVLDDIRDS